MTVEYDRLVEAFKDAAVHLIAAASAYEKYAGNSERRGLRDPFFKTRKTDFDKAVARVCEIYKEICE